MKNKVCPIPKQTKVTKQQHTFDFFFVSALLWDYSLCCVFRPAFGCCAHPKAGPNISRSFDVRVATFFIKPSYPHFEPCWASKCWTLPAIFLWTYIVRSQAGFKPLLRVSLFMNLRTALLLTQPPRLVRVATYKDKKI